MKAQQIEILMVAPGTGSQGDSANYADILASKVNSHFTVTRIETIKNNTLFDKLIRLTLTLTQSLKKKEDNK